MIFNKCLDIEQNVISGENNRILYVLEVQGRIFEGSRVLSLECELRMEVKQEIMKFERVYIFEIFKIKVLEIIFMF